MVWHTGLSKPSLLQLLQLFSRFSPPKDHLPLKRKPSISNLWGWRCPPIYSNNLYIIKHHNKYGGPQWYRKLLGTITSRKTCIYHPKEHRSPSWVHIVYVLVGSVVLYKICETIPYTNRTHIVFFPPSGDKVLAERYFKKEKLGVLSEKHPDSVRVKSIGEQIVKALESDLEAMKRKSWRRLAVDHLVGIKWEFLVVDDPKTQGGSFPGGKILVSSGFLKHLESDAEIATVIGHEVANIVARHASDTVYKRRLVIVAKKYLGLATSKPKKADHNQHGVSELGRALFQYPGMRRNEREADYIGLLLMASAGFDPQEAPKVHLIDEPSSTSKSDFYKTHPSGKKRAKYLTKPKVMEEAKSIYSKAIATRKMNDIKDG